MFPFTKSASPLQTAATAAVNAVLDPATGATLGDARALIQLGVDAGRVKLTLALGYPQADRSALRSAVDTALRAVPGVDAVELELQTRIQAHAVQPGLKPLPGVRNIIAVASGKGGVGKSTTAVNLALALAAEGARVGLLDADIYGPSQPMMLGLHGKPDSADGKTMEPLQAFGLQAMSIGVLMAPDQPMIWRGPMATQALEQLLRQTRWQDLDYLIVDLPPGTGDIQLTLGQKVPVAGAVIVTTPQDIALLDASKGLKMFEKVNVPVLGIVENMAVHVCSNCGHAEHVFGTGGGERMAADYGVELLGALPLDLQIRLAVDRGQPSVVADPDGVAAQAYRAIARRVGVLLAQRPRDYAGKFPDIVVSS